MDFLETTEGIVLIVLVSLIIGYIILYNIIKSAIKDAFKEMKKNEPPPPTRSIPTPHWTKAQLDLLARYEKGEISFEDYNTEWSKL